MKKENKKTKKESNKENKKVKKGIKREYINVLLNESITIEFINREKGFISITNGEYNYTFGLNRLTKTQNNTLAIYFDKDKSVKVWDREEKENIYLLLDDFIEEFDLEIEE